MSQHIFQNDADLHQLHLIAGDGRIREQFCGACQCPPSREREWNQDALEVGVACKGAEQFLIRVDTRPAALEGDGMRLRPLQGPCDRLRHVFHVGRLQSGAAAAEHRIDRKPAQEFEDGGEKCVVRFEHHRRTKEDYVGECGLHRQFAFPALADVEGWRGGIGPEPETWASRSTPTRCA